MKLFNGYIFAVGFFLQSLGCFTVSLFNATPLKFPEILIEYQPVFGIEKGLSLVSLKKCSGVVVVALHFSNARGYVVCIDEVPITN